MNKRKILLWIATICLLAALIPSTVFAATGWQENSDGSWSYYDANGVKYNDGVYNINGKYYGFDYYGKMRVDCTFDVYDNNEYRWVYYRAKADGSLYVNEWYEDDWGDWYYYGAEGAAPSGFYKVGSTWYYFYGDGQLREEGLVEDNGKYYYLYNEGKSYVTLTTAGWYNVAGDYIYYEGNGELAQNEVKYIGGKYYGFNWNGNMYKDASFSASVYDEAKDQWVYDYYRAKADGTLYVNSWYENEGGDWYYYGAAGKAPRDFTKIGNTWYFFNNGHMVQNQRVYSETYGKDYRISEDGTSYIEVPQNGWYSLDGKYYYAKDGQDYSDGIYQIGGAYYAFQWDGQMYADCAFDIYNYDESRWVYYRAKADGTLYVNTWYKDNYGNYYYYGDKGAAPRYEVLKIGGAYYGFGYDGQAYTNTSFSMNGFNYRAKKDGVLYVNEWYKSGSIRYYYGAEGKGANDFLSVGGVWYFFSDGQMMKNCLVYSESYKAYFVLSADGTSSTKVASSGWISAGNDFYYIKDGEVLSGGVYNIGGKYYGFDYSGKMYNDRDFGFDKYEADGNWYYYNYRAKEGGVLYVNEWYQNGDTWYYYGAEGKGADDFVSVGGAWYFFENGRMITNRLVWSDKYEAFYVISADGKSSREIKNDGWVTVGQDYYYILDGQICRERIVKSGSKYYAFNYDGKMITNQSYWVEFYNEEKDLWVDGECYAKADGTLYVNEWRQDGSTWYYYGADGLGENDFVKVGSTWYFFENGRMVVDRLVWSDNYEGYYVISADGKSSREIKSKGWVTVGSDYYYIGDNGLVQDETIKIGNVYYGFNWEGKMYKNCIFEVYNSEEDRWAYHRAKADGTLYTNSWYQDGSSWYYYGANGASPNGYTELGGAHYYFNYEGAMYTSTCTSVGGTYYAFGADGKQITAQGKQDLGSYFVYVKADGSLVEGWQKIGSNWHYFSPRMTANTMTEIEDVLYAVNNAGVCVAVSGNGIYDIGTSGKVYVQNGKVVENTWKQVNGSWYYFGETMYTYGVYDIDGERYVFDKDGKMFTGGWFLMGYSDYYDYNYAERYYVYADAAGKAATGVKKIGNTEYVFDDYGSLYTSTTVTIDGVNYVVNASGAVVSKLSGNGWKQVDGKYYYVKNGEPVYEDVVTIGGKMYAFNSNGEMITNQAYWVNEGRVMAKADGTLVVNGWYQYKNGWYYSDSDGYLVSGKQTISGKSYYFSDGLMRVGTFVWNGKIVTTDANGVVVSEKSIADGWSYVDGRVLYYKNGEPFSGWVGDYLIRDGEMSINDYWDWEGAWYAFDVYGKYVKSGWHSFNYGSGDYSEYVYAKSGGVLCYDEWLQVGGKWYYFSGVFMLSDGVYEVDGKLCKFDENGVYKGEVAAVSGSDGWKQVGSVWYYLHAGEPVTGIKWIDGKRYVFDWNGAMVTNGFVDYESGVVYADSNGMVPNYTGWKKINGEWVYFDNSNMPVIGWFQDGGKEYYADAWYDSKGNFKFGVVTGYMYYDAQLYYFNSSGVCQGTKGVKNGWYKADGEWYYFRDGSLLNGYQIIDGKGYYFERGVMMTYCYTSYGYFGADGVQRTTVGWYKTELGWIYVMDSSGKLASGVQKIGGKEYYFFSYIQVR